MPTTTIKYFTLGGHLPDEARSINLMFFDFAHRLEDMLPDGPEKSAGMRKLLEAKDCFVRAKIDAVESQEERPMTDITHPPAQNL